MISKKILIIDDEDQIRSLLEDLFKAEGFMVISSADTEEGYKKALKSQPDMILLDIKIPRIGGIELCRLLRSNQQTKNIPIIMLTVESSETDKVIGLEMGADDYITKPFNNKELIARVKSLLRRVNRKEEVQAIKADGLELDIVSRTVRLNNREIALRPKEFDLLNVFLKKPNVVLEREFILENVFEYQTAVTTRTIDTHIKNLRQALGKWSKRIVTVFGRGFKFVPDSTKK